MNCLFRDVIGRVESVAHAFVHVSRTDQWRGVDIDAGFDKGSENEKSQLCMFFVLLFITINERK